MQTVRIVDSHTGGEPTRLVLDGAPDLGDGPLSVRAERFRRDHDRFRSAVVNEPRGSDTIVGALLVPPDETGCELGVIFFNNVGVLGMCGHGTIGVVATLAALGKLPAGTGTDGTLRIDTPVGAVSARHLGGPRVSVVNVPSRRTRKAVRIAVPHTADAPGPRSVTGDVAWAGNWFFLCADHGLDVSARNLDALTDYSKRVKAGLVRAGVTGEGGAEIDHIELFAPPSQPGRADSRSFVLCPGNAYDRSPCGTGTSAKIACLAAEEKLPAGKVWRQESVIGSVFEASWAPLRDGASPTVDGILPTVTGEAFVTAEATLRLDPADPFCWGIRP